MRINYQHEHNQRMQQTEIFAIFLRDFLQANERTFRDFKCDLQQDIRKTGTFSKWVYRFQISKYTVMVCNGQRAETLTMTLTKLTTFPQMVFTHHGF